MRKILEVFCLVLVTLAVAGCSGGDDGNDPAVCGDDELCIECGDQPMCYYDQLVLECDATRCGNITTYWGDGSGGGPDATGVEGYCYYDIACGRGGCAQGDPSLCSLIEDSQVYDLCMLECT